MCLRSTRSYCRSPGINPYKPYFVTIIVSYHMIRLLLIQLSLSLYLYLYLSISLSLGWSGGHLGGFFSKWRPARGRSSWRSAKIETVCHRGHMSQIWCFWKNLNQKPLSSLTIKHLPSYDQNGCPVAAILDLAGAGISQSASMILSNNKVQWTCIPSFTLLAECEKFSSHIYITVPRYRQLSGSG